MQLLNMDVELNGASSRLHLGPFAPGLNAIYGPAKSGKTGLLRWLRHVLSADLSRRWDVGSPDYSDLPHRAESAGTRWFAAPAGSLEVLSRGDRWRFGYGRNGELSTGLHALNRGLSSLQCELFDALGAADGARDVEAELEQVAQRFGFDAPIRSLETERQQWTARLREVEARLSHPAELASSRDVLLRRREELERELTEARENQSRTNDTARALAAVPQQRRYDARWHAIEADLRDTQARIAEFDQQLSELRGELKVLETSRSSVRVDDSYRAQLQELDDRLTRWRQTLRDLKAHRSRIEHEATDAQLDRQVGEQLSMTKEPDPRGALRSLETQILSARSQLDALVDRYSVLHESRPDAYLVRKDDAGRTRIAYASQQPIRETGSLPETLRSMQKDLYEACQHLARYESRAVTETLKQQSEQLQRCEVELLQAVQKSIEQRAALLRKIANEYQLSHEQLALAFGDWCDCYKHEHLQDWLMSEQPSQSCQVGQDPLMRQKLLDRIQALESERQSAVARVEHCQRQWRDTQVQLPVNEPLPIAPSTRWPADIQRDVDAVSVQLRQYDEREHWLQEAAELRRKLDGAQWNSNPIGHFRSLVHRHIAGLMGGHRAHWNGTTSYRCAVDTPQPRYDLVDGLVYDQVQRFEAEVPPSLVSVAWRLALVQAAAERDEPVSLVLDASLDHLTSEIQRTAGAYLAQVAASGQQLILLTADPHIATVVRQQGGWVGQLSGTARPVEDVNRQLLGLANDYEADKWYHPPMQTEPFRPGPPLRGEFYLTPRSRIEESPSIDSVAAARCQAAAVDRIGDLLDVDPRWLADQLRLDGVTEATVSNWQAEAHLLCSVRQLRPFDTRLLVAVGVRSPQQLAQMHPSQLLDRVERFVATDRGQRLLRSGSSYELSRITSWIASAKGGTNRLGRSSLAQPRTPRANSAESRSGYYAHDYALEPAPPEYDQDWEALRHERAPRSDYGSQGDRSPLNGASRRRQLREPSVRTARRAQAAEQPGLKRSGERQRSERPKNERLKLAQADYARSESVGHRFYLELSSPLVDAPSIGPRMAERLQQFGIYSVDQLLSAHVESLADKLNMRRVDAETIRAWQEQARMVCRIPHLRGHDAQLLVACNLTSPEHLATMDPAAVLAQVTIVAASSQGQRILRGAKQPDLQEVKDWILWASQCRALHAA